jgi:uncharacterized protein
MPSLGQGIGDGVVVADRRDERVLLFDTTQPRWWVVHERELQNPTERRGLVRRLKSDAPPCRDTETPSQYYLIYKLTDKCNYTCSYCYDRSFTRKRNAIKRNAAVREYLSRLSETSPGSEVNILFHGGEPLLEFDEIQDVVRYASEFTELRTGFSLQTNVSLLDRTKFDFLRVHRVGLSVSVDGVGAGPNWLRQNSYDPDCYGFLLRKIDEIQDLTAGSMGLLMTIGAHNVATAANDILQAQRDGFRSVSFSLMHEIDQNTQPAAASEVETVYETLMDQVVAGELSALAVWPLIELLEISLFGRGSSFCSTSPCGAGRNLTSILPSGEIAPCDSLFSADFVFADHDAYALGKSNSAAFRDLLKRDTSTLSACQTCDVLQFCNGTCPGNALLSEGAVNTVAPAECDLHYRLTRLAAWRLAERGDALLGYVRRHVEARRGSGGA